MDPNANLQEQENILTTAWNRLPARGTTKAQDRAELRELRRALVEWLRAGGFAPQWQKCPVASRYWRRNRWCA